MPSENWVHHKPLRSLASSPSAPQGLCFCIQGMSRRPTGMPGTEAAVTGEPERVRAGARLTTESLLTHIGAIVGSCEAVALFVYADALEIPLPELSLPADTGMFCVTRDPTRVSESAAACVQRLRAPDVPLTRIGQVKIAAFLALSKGCIKRGDRIVFLSGLASTKTLDTLIVTEVGREYEILTSSNDLQETVRDIMPEVTERVVDLASELGSEGRERRSVGAIFVVGDAERVISMTRQLILNPFKGYSPQERNVLDYSLEKTVKELATIDGAFVVRGDGVIETCGAYIGAAIHKTINHGQRIDRFWNDLPGRANHNRDPRTPQYWRKTQPPPHTS